MKLILLFILSLSVLSRTVDKRPTNNMVRGDRSSATEKSFEFNSGLGPLNPKLFTSNGSQLGLFTKEIVVGDGTPNQVDIVIDVGLGALNPRFRWNQTDEELTFSNDGDQFDAIGSGSGGGGGENFNNAFTSDDNANAEQDLAGWTYSGSGAFTIDDVDPLEGDQSFQVTSGAVNDSLTSPLLNVNRDVFRGRSCQASIDYIGGGNEFEMLIVDAAGVQLPLSQVRRLPNHTITASESVFFICPTVASITANANLASARILIRQIGAAATIKFDRSYLGTNFGLSELTLPDLLTAKISSIIDGAEVSSEGGDIDWIDGSNCSISGTFVTCPFVSGSFSQLPSCGVFAANTTGNQSTVNINSLTVNEITFNPRASSTANASSIPTTIGAVDIHCARQGQDARQKVVVQRSVPRIAEFTNEFSATINLDNTVASQGATWISGDCTNPTGGNATCPFIPGLFTQEPSCTASYDSGGSFGRTVDVIESLNDVRVVTRVSSNGGLTNSIIKIKCSRQGSDVRSVMVQPMITGQVFNSTKKNITTEWCRVFGSGTKQVDNSSGLCGWIDTVVDIGTGRTQLLWSNFSKNPVCLISAEDQVNSDNANCFGGSSPTTGNAVGVRADTTGTTVNCETTTTGANADFDFNISCTGEAL